MACFIRVNGNISFPDLGKSISSAQANGLHFFLDPVGTQLFVEFYFLQFSRTSVGTGRDCTIMDLHCLDDSHILSHQKMGRSLADTLFVVGNVCHYTEYINLAAQLSGYQIVFQLKVFIKCHQLVDASFWCKLNNPVGDRLRKGVVVRGK